MPSLSGYDKGKKCFQGRTYSADIASGCDFNERLYAPIRQSKRKKPYSIFLEGNHEQRLARAIQLSPELEGAISYKDYDITRWYDTYVPYAGSTPGTVCINGVTYAHFCISGLMGRPVGGEHPAHSLLRTQFGSTVVGHNHLAEWVSRTTTDGRRIHGLCCGSYLDYDADWAGNLNRLWWSGVVILHNVDNGNFEPQFVSIDSLRKEYGSG